MLPAGHGLQEEQTNLKPNSPFTIKLDMMLASGLLYRHTNTDCKCDSVLVGHIIECGQNVHVEIWFNVDDQFVIECLN